MQDINTAQRNLEAVEIALQFLDRADLKGAEVPAFVKANNYLHEQRMLLRAQLSPVAPAAETIPDHTE